MKKIRNTTAWILLIVLIIGLFAGCSKEGNPDAESGEPETTTAAQTTAVEETTKVEPGQTRPITDPDAPLEYEISYTNVYLYEVGSGSVWIQAIAEITNTGEAALSLDTATFHVKNDAGETIASKGNIHSYPTVLTAGEKGYFYIETPIEGTDVNAQMTLDPQVEISKTSLIRHTFEASDTKLSTNALGDLTVTGKIENTTDKSFKTVYIAAVLYDKNNLPIGVIPSSLSYSLLAGETAELECSAFALPDTIDKEAVASFTIWAYAITAT